jgi:site-specific recombinase XerC
MPYDTKPGWSRVFVDPTASVPRRTRRHVRAEVGGVPTGPTVHETIDEFLEAVDEGSARDRFGRTFTREAARDLHWYLRGHVGEALGTMSLNDVRRRDVEALIYELAGTGLSHGRLRALAKSVRALFDYADERGLVQINPAERVAVPEEDEPQQPHARSARRVDQGLERSVADHAISLALRVATVGFVLTALIFLAESI